MLVIVDFSIPVLTATFCSFISFLVYMQQDHELLISASKNGKVEKVEELLSKNLPISTINKTSGFVGFTKLNSLVLCPPYQALSPSPFL